MDVMTLMKKVSKGLAKRLKVKKFCDESSSSEEEDDVIGEQLA